MTKRLQNQLCIVYFFSFLFFTSCGWCASRPTPAQNYAIRIGTIMRDMASAQGDMDLIVRLMDENARAWYEHETKLVSNGILEPDNISKKFESYHNSLIPKLLPPLSRVRHNARRLSAINPVPRSCKRADQAIEKAGSEFDEGLNSLKRWIYNGDGKDRQAYKRHFESALTLVDKGLSLIPINNRRDTHKTYIPG